MRQLRLIVRCDADEVGNDLDWMDKTLIENERDDLDGRMTRNHFRVDEGLEDGFQVNLNDGRGHAGRHVAHLFQVLFVAIFAP